MTICRTLVLLSWLILALACGDGTPLPPPLGGAGGGAGDSGLFDADLPDGGTPDANLPDGGDGGMLTGDLCTSHLSGISCQVEEIAYGGSILGERYICARFSDGSVRCILGEPADPDEILFIALTAPAVQIIARASDTVGVCALQNDNQVLCWSAEHQAVRVVSFGPGQVELLAAHPRGGICAVVSGQMRCAETVWCVASDQCSYDLNLRTLDFGSRLITDLAAGCAITDDSELLCWGIGANGSDPDLYSIPSPSLVPIDFGDGASVAQVSRTGVFGSEGEVACAILDDGDLRCWGTNYRGQLGHVYSGDVTQAETALRSMEQPPVQQVSVRGEVSCVLTEAGAVRCWGWNIDGALGMGDRQQRGGLVGAPDYYKPYSDVRDVDLGTGRTALQVIAGTCALLDDHSVKCWGAGIGDEPGEMGDDLERVNFGTLTRAESDGFPPVVSVVSPELSSDPADAVEGDSLEVTCDVRPPEMFRDPVDPNGVVIRVVDPADPTIALLETRATLVTGTTYVGTLNGLSALATGSHRVECVALDSAEEPRTGRGSVAILYDGGPNVAVLSPSTDGAVVGQTLPLHLEIEALPALLAEADPAAAVTSVEAVLGGVPVVVTEGVTEGHYTADVDLLGDAFEPPPSGPVLLSVTATNMRGQSRTVLREIVVDDTGPVITVTGTVMEGTLVRGVETIRLQVVDAVAGTAPSSVRGYVAGNPTALVFSLVGQNYEAVIDTPHGLRATQLPILITASDLVGNESELPLTLRLDNAAPLVSLDPPDIRETKRGVGSRLLCSAPFDPVGSDSVNDQQIAPEGAEFRARIEDQNPLSGSGVVASVAGVDPNEVVLYMLTDLTRPILIDTNNDGVCDDINPEATLLQRELAVVTPAGRSHFSASASGDNLDPPWDANVCDAGNEATAPTRICPSTSPLTRAIKAPIPGGNVGAIWGLPLVDSLNCVGRAWDWRLDQPQGGPVCVVVRAVDRLGNVGVSVPLRLCLQRSSGNAVDCSADVSWRNHDCLSGTYLGQPESCSAPPDFPADGLGAYVRENP